MAPTIPLKVVVGSLFIGLVLYYANAPVPDVFLSSPDRWRMRILAAGGDLLTSLENSGLSPLAVWWENVMISFRGSWGATNVTFADTTFDGVNVRVYQPANLRHRKEAIAGMVFIPGGGWIYGNSDSYHGVTVHIASKLHVMLVSIDYRKAHQHPFPAALDDCTKAAVWFLKNAEKLKVDPNRIAVVGEGAGGALAAAVTQRLHLESEYRSLPKVKLQVLFYPMLQAFDFNTPSYQQNGVDSSLLFTRTMSARFWSFYVQGNDALVEEFVANNHTSISAKMYSTPGKLLAHDNIPDDFKPANYVTPSNNHGNEETYRRIKHVLENPEFNPLFCKDLSGLPQTYIAIGEFDVVRDEDKIFAERLDQAGVDVTQKYYTKGLHGMFSYFMEPMILSDGKKCMDDFIEFARHHL